MGKSVAANISVGEALRTKGDEAIKGDDAEAWTNDGGKGRGADTKIQTQRSIDDNDRKDNRDTDRKDNHDNRDNKDRGYKGKRKSNLTNKKSNSETRSLPNMQMLLLAIIHYKIAEYLQVQISPSQTPFPVAVSATTSRLQPQRRTAPNGQRQRQRPLRSRLVPTQILLQLRVKVVAWPP